MLHASITNVALELPPLRSSGGPRLSLFSSDDSRITCADNKGIGSTGQVFRGSPDGVTCVGLLIEDDDLLLGIHEDQGDVRLGVIGDPGNPVIQIFRE